MVTKEKIKEFPDSPGVYLMKDARGQVIYVGKAVSLKKRVASYFLKTQGSLKTQVQLGYVERIDFIETPSEYDALILESQLIKQYQPRFNISLKDDKSFPYIRITQEAFPRVFIGRRPKAEREEDASTESLSIKPEGNLRFDYFGPYTSANLLRRALNILRKSFPFCTCRRFPKRPCLNYDLGLCPQACQGKISQKKYRRIIKDLEDFLTKKDQELIEELSSSMRQKVREEKFEEAAGVRDKLEALSILIALKKSGGKSPYLLEEDFGKCGLSSEPKVIEAFDISNISGNFAVGSMVSFRNGKPDKSRYRRFKIRSVFGADDYAMIREVVRRRYGRLLRESQALPDLIVIDGGKGHLKAGLSVLRELKLDIPMIAIAKREEVIYTVGRQDPLRLGRDSVVLRLFQHIRNEAHRFAVNYHRLLRSKDL